jgi:hypothetical protein
MPDSLGHTLPRLGIGRIPRPCVTHDVGDLGVAQAVPEARHEAHLSAGRVLQAFKDGSNQVIGCIGPHL